MGNIGILNKLQGATGCLFSVGEIQGNKKSEVVKVKFITRSHTQGGEPKLKCSAEQIGKEFKEPFNATFIFWGNK